MSSMFNQRIILVAFAVTVLTAASSVSALTATQIVEKEIVTQNADGTTLTTRVPAASVVPGERIVYTLKYLNDSVEPASDLVMTMPVPKEVTLIDGSAERDGAVALYSVDGGESFSPRETLQVVGAAGASRLAVAEDITHIRWTVVGPVQSSESGELVFKGILK